MSVQHYKNGQLSIIAGAGGIGGGDGEESFTGTKTEVEQAIAAGLIKENWTVYITDDIEEVVGGASGNCGCKIEYVTQEQYDALPKDKLTNDIEYRITDNNPATPSAKNMAYDNSKSGIEAVNVQDAIDEVNESLNNVIDENVTFGSEYTIDYISCQKIGKIVFLTFTIVGTNIASGSILGSVSALPRNRAFTNAQIRTGTSSDGRQNAIVSVETDGTISVFHNTSNTRTIMASLMYVCS